MITYRHSFYIFAISIFYVSSVAKNNEHSEEKQLLPAVEEDFQEAIDLVVSWQSSGCQNNIDHHLREPGCHLVTGKEWTSSDVLTLYNKVTFLKADGDWAYVEGGTYQKTYRGWIRWRKGREMMVKDLYGLLIIQKTI